jgi:hypothetical protein
LAFDGIVDAMQVGWTEAVGPLSGRSAWTFEAWVNPADLSMARVIYAEATATGDTLAIRLAPNGSGATRLEVGLRRAGVVEWSGATVASSTMAVGMWSHVAVAFEVGNRLDLAVNGATIASLTTTAATTAPDVAPVTSRVARPGDITTGLPLAGTVDEVRGWSVARTYDGVDTTYAQKLLGTEAGLILHYPMGAYAANGSDAKGLTLVDQSPSKLVSTLSGGVRWVASRAPVDRPATPMNLGLAFDTGQSSTDGITNVSFVSGSGSPGSVIRLSVDGEDNQATSVVSGAGTFVVAVNLDAGVRRVTARAIGTTNLSSMKSATATFTVDVTPPLPGTITVSVIEGQPVVTVAGANDTGHPGAGLASAQLQVATPMLTAPWVVFQDIGLPVTLPQSGSAPLTVPAAWSGFNQFRVSVSDIAGNIAHTAALNVGTDNVPPTIGTLRRNATVEPAANWNRPTFVMSAVDVGNVGSVSLQVAGEDGIFADTPTSMMSGTVSTLGDIYTLQPAAIQPSVRWVRARVTDVAGNVVYSSNAIFMAAWGAGVADPAWPLSGNAALVSDESSGSWLRLTPPGTIRQRGGAHLASKVLGAGAFTVGFDLKVSGAANGTCMVLFTDTTQFTTFMSNPLDGGGDSLGCIGLPGAVAFVGIEEYGDDSIRLGPTTAQSTDTYPVEAQGAFRYFWQRVDEGILANTTNDVRVTIVVQPQGASTKLAVWTQVGNGSSDLVMTRTVDASVTSNGAYVGISGAVDDASGEHKVRNIVVAALETTEYAGPTLDTTPPAVALAYSDSGLTNAAGPYKAGDTVTVTATFTDASSLGGNPIISLVPGTYVGGTLPTVTLTKEASGQIFNGTVIIPAGNGTVTATVDAIDTAGNVLHGVGQAGFVIDNTIPTAGTISLGGANGNVTTGIVQTGMPIFTLTGASDTGPAASGVATVQLQIASGLGATSGFMNNGQPAAQSGGATSFVATTLADGPYTARVAVTDVAGNVAYTPPVNVTVDTTPPTVSQVQRQVIAESSSTWNAPKYAVTTTDATSGITSVVLQVGPSASGAFTDSGSPVTQPYSGSIYVVSGPTISGTQWVRMRVTDVAGNEAITIPMVVATWSGAVSDSAWTIGGSASSSGGYLILTPSSTGQKGGAYYVPLVPTKGQVSVSFDLEVNGGADGMCVPFFSSPSAFLSGGGGGSLGCQGMAGSYFVGIEEYGTDTIRIGVPNAYDDWEQVVSGLANTSNAVRVTIILTPQNGSTFIDVQAQVGTAPPLRYASRTMSGTLPAAGVLIGLTAATGGESAEHKVRNIVISGS